MGKVCFFLFAAITLVNGQDIQPRSDQTSPAVANLFLADGRIRAQLRRLDTHIDRQQWRDAIALCRFLSDNSADARVETSNPESFDLIVPLKHSIASRLVRIAGQTADEVVEFRNRSELQAKYLFDSAMSQRDPILMRRVIDEFPSSSYARRSAFVRGEMELSKGNFNSARRNWWIAQNGFQALRDRQLDSILAAKYAEDVKKLVGEAPSLPFGSVPFSNADVDARFVLVSLLEGNRARAKRELDLFRKVHGNTKGVLGGQSVVLADELRRLIEFDMQYSSPRIASIRNDSSANGISPSYQPSWRFVLPESEVIRARNEKPQIQPQVSNGLILFSTGSSLHAVNADDGTPVEWSTNEFGKVYPTNQDSDSAGSRGSRANFFSLSADGSKLFARLVDSEDDRLIGIDLNQQGKLLFAPISTEDAEWTFDGCPIVEDDRLYVVMWRVSRNPEMFVACFESGELQWRQKICSIERSAFERQSVGSNGLLTLVEDELFLNSNLGFVSSISRYDGSTRWICRYPRTRFSATNLLDRPWYRQRIRNPCIVHEGILYALPSDFDGMFAIDVLSGSLVWKTEFPAGRFDALSVLGIAGDNILVGGRRLWGINRLSGKICRKFPENPFPRDLHNRTRGFGLGACVANHVLWPVKGNRDRLFFFDGLTGRMSRQAMELGVFRVSAGNLVVSDDWLLITGNREIVAFRNRSERSSKDSSADRE